MINLAAKSLSNMKFLDGRLLDTVKDTVILMRSSIGESFRGGVATGGFRDLSRSIGTCELTEAQHLPCSSNAQAGMHRTVIGLAKCLSDMHFQAIFLPSTADPRLQRSRGAVVERSIRPTVDQCAH